MYLLVVGTMFVFTACNCGAGDAAATDSGEVVACAADCQKACCLGCKATEGEKRCIVLKDGSMPCCTVDHDADIEYEEGYGEESHEGHNHGEGSHDGHNHE